MVEIVDESVTVDEFARTVRQYQPSVRFNGGYGEDLLKVLKETMDDVDTSIEELYDQIILETASGEHLEKIGLKYDIERKINETDSRLRKRIQLIRLVGQSRGTYTDIAEIVIKLFEADVSEVELVRPKESGLMGTVIIRVPEKRVDNSPFTISEIESLLGDALIGGHRAIIEESDAFRFGDPNNGFGSEWGQEFK